MLLSITRTMLLYALTMFSLRLMGKRQIGELKPSDLATTILISNLASVPVEETNLPFLPAIAPILVICSLEILLSFLESRSERFSKLLSGESIPIILNGKVCQAAMNSLRFSMDDLMEALRQKDVFDINTVSAAIVETSGKLSVLLKQDAENGTPAPLICDGTVNHLGAQLAGVSSSRVADMLAENGNSIENVLLLQVTGKEVTANIRKEETR